MVSIHPHMLLNTLVDRRTIRLVEILGVGAYGVVYLGFHVKTGRRYAVKLLTHTTASADEARLHAKVSKHPNVLTLERVITENGLTMLVLEYAPNGDLFTAITQPGHNVVGNHDAIRDIFLQILDAVAYCHNQGVYHRDLKPENILLFPNRHVKLADFGLATHQPISSQLGCGSTFYFSPECQNGTVWNNARVKGYDTLKNDVWSLGVILINLVAGRNPWKQANLRDPTFAAYVQRPEHFFTTVLPCLSKELERILLRIFCLDPSRRISLPELRRRILRCHSFSSHQLPKPSPKVKQPVAYTPDEKTMPWSNSTAIDLQHYVHGYTDDALPKSSSPHALPRPPIIQMPPPVPYRSCSSSSGSSESSCPPTPHAIEAPPFSVAQKTTHVSFHIL